MKSNHVARLRFISLLIFLVALLFISRLFFIQVVKADYYVSQADRQYLQSSSAGTFERGNIFFTDKDGQNISAATIKSGFVLAVNTLRLADPEKTYKNLNPILSLDHDNFIKLATKLNDPYEEVTTRLDESVTDQIKGLKLPGVNLYKQKWRFYPAGTSTAHVIGLMGYQGNDYAGRYGLEKFYDKILSRSNNQSFANFFVETFAGLGKAVAHVKDDTAGDLVTSIEPAVQKFLETQLVETKDHWQADSAGGIVLDPKTGEILAMAALPAFNPGDKQTDLSVLPNPLVESVYEMGSIIKPLTMAAGLDTGAVTAATTYNDKGCLTLNSKKICNYDGKARGVISMQEVLNQSLNLGATFVEQQLGRERFRQYFLNYGLAEKTGIDLPGEVSGKLANLNENQDINFATASFGQGIALSPIATARALAALGNGGYLIEPHIVKRIDYQNKISQNIEPKIIRQVIKPATGDEITRMLVKVVDEKLAEGKIKLDHYSVAAKTGTAQIADPTGGYYDDRYLHSFFGYFPAFSPRFLVFMYLVYPKGVRYSSETLTEPFSNITKFLLNYYQIPPDR